jgi:hypothetical protein
MNSIFFIFARTYLGIDTGWDLATGAPTGLVKDPWNIRFVPHYWLGVFFRPRASRGRDARPVHLSPRGLPEYLMSALVQVFGRRQ